MPLKIALLQIEVTLGNPGANRHRAGAAIQQAAARGADAVILPEMWNTGFFPENVREVADIRGEPGRGLLAGWARQHRVHIFGGSLAEVWEGRVYNTACVYNPDGELVLSYRKAHLFTLAREHLYFHAGGEIVVGDLAGLRFGLALCYDLRFPEFMRTLALHGAQVLVVPAQWPASRREHWRTLLRARAIENQCFVMGVNASGRTGTGQEWAGHSAALDPWGEYLAEAGAGEEILLADVEARVVQEIRSNLNVFRDRRPELYRWPGLEPDQGG